MSKVSDLSLDIKELLDLDIDPRRVAVILEVPVSFVYEVMEADLDEDKEIYYGAWQTGKTCYTVDTLANNGAEMEYTLITKTGKVMQFYVKAVAELYLSLNGGVLVTNDILVTKETQCKSPSL